ncbi:MarR family transcriptional regulator [Streptomyces brevispora]|uniref:MarR family transcriptional regulator n=1 Tax=Streptomyces brevispora TaxID=887462 RepID=UPI0039A637BF
MARGYSGDRVVLAYVARRPGATAKQVAQALGIPDGRVAVNLDRLTDDGLLVVASPGASGSPCLYLLPPTDGEPEKASGT